MIPSAPAIGHRRGKSGAGDVGHGRLDDRDVDPRELADPVGCGTTAAGAHRSRGSIEVAEAFRGEDAEAPRFLTRSASALSEVTTRISCGRASAAPAARSRHRPSSRPALGACAISITDEWIGTRGGRSSTTVTFVPSVAAQLSSFSTSAAVAPLRSFHQPSGRLPITFIASTIHLCDSRGAFTAIPPHPLHPSPSLFGRLPAQASETGRLPTAPRPAAGHGGLAVLGRIAGQSLREQQAEADHHQRGQHHQLRPRPPWRILDRVRHLLQR